MPGKRKPSRKFRHAHDLTFGQWMELLIGLPPSGDPGFGSDAECRAAWLAHREALLAHCAGNCTRPWAWWEFEFGWHPPGGVGDFECLAVLGLLTPGERLLGERKGWLAPELPSGVDPRHFLEQLGRQRGEHERA